MKGMRTMAENDRPADARVQIDVNVNQPRSAAQPSTPAAAPIADVKVERRSTSDYKTYPTTNFPPGKTIGQIKSALWDKFDLRENMIPLVNGEKVGDDYVTKPGDNVMFQPAPKDRGFRS